ncbi:MAG: aromatic acid decarboxylase [Thermoprotei archaeon]|nr:MAG: aromatic acid decarboxylase [Thermoprotei archaeon]
MRIVVGISGTTGTLLGVRLLEVLRDLKVETHTVMTRTAERILLHEHGVGREEVIKLSSRLYEIDDMFAPIASGSFKTDGMVVIPCSVKTLAGVAHGYSDNLLLRAADVTLKERRKLILVVRETPLNIIHLENMLKVARAGAVILPPVLTFYHKPRGISDFIDYVIGKVLDILGLEHNLYVRWSGL